MEIDTQAALAELQGEGTEEVQQTEAPQQAETEVEYYDLPYNGQTIKLPLNHEIPLFHNGATQNVPFGKLLNGYRNAAHLEAKQKEFKEKLSQMEPAYEEYNKYKDSLLALQKWSQEKPDEFEAIWDMYQNRQQHLLSGGQPSQEGIAQLPPDHPIVRKLAEVTEKLNQYDERFAQQERLAAEQEEQEIVGQIEQEIASFKEEFKHIDLDSADMEGISLRGRIMQFGAEKGYPDFRSAALSYKFPDGTPLLARLMDTAKTQGRNEAVKAVKQDNMNGILSRSRTPNQGQGTGLDVKRLDDSTRYDLALEELTRSPMFNKG